MYIQPIAQNASCHPVYIFANCQKDKEGQASAVLDSVQDENHLREKQKILPKRYNSQCTNDRESIPTDGYNTILDISYKMSTIEFCIQYAVNSVQEGKTDFHKSVNVGDSTYCAWSNRRYLMQ